MAGMMSAADPWMILPVEKSKYDAQFVQLKPTQGIVTGDQARGFFLQSQLPPAILGQIWALADTNSDGKMDNNEFAIAMKLVQMKLKGHELPKVLPPSLKIVPVGGMGMLAGGLPPPPQSAAASLAGSRPVLPTSVPGASVGFPVASFGMIAPTAHSSSLYGGINIGGQSLSGALPPSVVTAVVQPVRPASPVDAKMQRSASATSQDSPTGSVGSPLQEWAVPHQSKLKYTQLFNTNDRMRSGYLTGPQARHLLVQTGLAQPVLAQIWGLADLDGDGRLTCEEFCVALHLADCVRAGDKLPTALPADLVPPSFRKKRSPSLTGAAPATTSSGVISGVPQAGSASAAGGDLSGLSQEEKALRALMMNTFEDKRRENFEKGQAELERRRQSLLENQRKEQEERERKEREEQEKREKIRQDQERRRQVELEKQLAKQREMEQEKEEQRRKAMEQREAARREMERQRQLEWEKQRRQELLSQRQKEQERVLQLKAQNQNLGIELEQLNEKVKDLNQKITNTRNGVADIKGIIDQMRITRDSKLSELEMLKRQIKEQNLKLIHLNQEKSTLGDQVKVNAVTNPTSDAFNLVMNSFSNKQITLKNLRDRLTNTETDVAQKLADIGNNNAQLGTLREQVRGLAASAEQLFRTYEEKRTAVLQIRQERGGVTRNGGDGAAATFGDDWEKEAWPSDVAATTAAWTASTEPPADWDETGGGAAWGAADGWPAAGDDGWPAEPHVAGVNGTSDGATIVKYRALYAFDARNLDELAIMPGDIVTVFPDRSTEPGWLSGELGGKHGWFPEAYVELLCENGIMADGGADGEDAEGSSLTGVRETVHIVGTEMKMTLSGIQEAPESISDNGSIGGETGAGDIQPSAFIQVPKSTATTGAASPVPGQGQSVEAGLQVQALFPWRAKKENHLSFNKGDLITIQEQQDIWWYGELDGRQGWFPKSYVKPVAVTGAKRPADGSASDELVDQNEARVSASELSSEDYYMAMYSYQSTEPGDLMFNQGDFISVIKMDGDWWTGTIGDRTGIFPSNYVKRMDELQEGDGSMPQDPPPEPEEEAPSAPGTKVEEVSAPVEKREAPEPPSTPKTKGGRKPNIATVIAPYVATGPEQLSLQKGQLISVKKKNQSGWWEGELHAKGKKRQVGWFPASYVKLLGSGDNSARSTPELGRSADESRNDPSNAAPKEQVMALYSYTAQNEDELSFVKDAVISVVSKDDPAWWRGEYDGHIGVFPANYVLEWDGSGGVGTDSQRSRFSGLDPTERKRQELINELIATEESYVEDMSIVLDAFYKPLKESRLLTEQELETIFVNWNDLIVCNSKFLKCFRVRRKLSRKSGGAIHLIGDILCENLPNLTPYMRFCCCQLNAAAIIQNKTETSQEFRDLTKKCCLDPRTKGMPISSFLLKPMQRITKYPLLIKKILECTPETHSDYHNLVEALSKAEDVCSQVNEGVREQENSDRLEHVQRVVCCDNLEEKIIFNSLTNSLGPRKFLHSGMLVKVNSSKELMAFLFNDFLLLTQPIKNFGSVGSLFALDKISNAQFKMYKQPILINQVDARKTTDSEDGVNFQLACGERTYLFKAVSSAERNVWVRKLEGAAVHCRDVEHRKNLKNQSTQVQQRPALGRLLVVVVEASSLRAKANVRRRSAVGNLRVIILGATNLLVNKAKGRSDPYCEASMGSQEHRTKVINDTVNPKWNASMQFTVKDPAEDVLCVTIYDRDYFSPNDFLGRTEIRIAEIIHKSSKKVGPIILKKQLLEVDSGDITLKLDIQLFS